MRGKENMCIQEHWSKLKKILFSMLLLLTTYFFVTCINKVADQKESFYSIEGLGKQYVDVSKKRIDVDFTAVGNDVTKIIVYTNNNEVNGLIRYCLRDKDDDNLIYEDSTYMKSNSSEIDNPLELVFSDCSLEKGNEYVLSIDLSEYTEPLSMMYTDSNLFYKQYYSFQHRGLYYGIIIAIYVLFIACIFWIYHFGFETKTFAIGNLILGTVVLMIMPPANRDEEYRHFLRAFELSRGELKAELIEIPVDSYGNSAFETEGGTGYYIDVPKKINDIRLVDYNTNQNNKSYFAEINGTINIDVMELIYKGQEVENYASVSLCAVADRNPLFYLPMTIMLWIAELLHVNRALYFYFARFGQLLACVLLGVVSLKIAPELKNEILLSTFAPPIILLRSSCNTDGLLISIVIFYISLLYCIRKNRIDLLHTKNGILSFLLIICTAAIITLMKLPYIIVCLGSLFILKKENVKTIQLHLSSRKMEYCCSIVLLIAVGIFLEIKTDFLSQRMYRILPKEHIQYLAANIFPVTKMFIAKFVQQTKELYDCMNVNTLLPYGLGMLVATAFSKRIFTKERRIIFCFTTILTLLSIILVGYTLTPPDYGSIWGITYRYMLPSVMLLLLCLPSGNSKSDAIVCKVVPMFVISILYSSLFIWFSTWWLCV